MSQTTIVPVFSHRILFLPLRDRIVDGVDQQTLLLGKIGRGMRDEFHYYEGSELQAVRKGDWKLRLPGLKNLRNWPELDRGSQKTELYNLKNDIGESKNVAGEHPDVVQRLTSLAKSTNGRDSRRR